MNVWDRLAELVMTRPWRVLAFSLLPVVLPLLALPTLRTSHDTLSTLPPSADAVQGYEALSRHLPPGETAPLVLVIDSDHDVYDPAAFRALGDLSRNLRRLPGVASVRSAAMPTNGERPADLDTGLAAEAGQLGDRLRAAAGGARELAGGIAQVDGALARIAEELPEPDPAAVAQLRSAGEGIDRLAAGLDGARRGTTELRDGVAQLRAGLAELGDGVDAARQATGQLRRDVAAPAEAALRRAVDALGDFTVGALDPRFADAAEAVGEAFGRVTGQFPPGHPQAGEQVREGYDGLDAALGELVAGLEAAGDGTAALDGGLGQLDAGLLQLDEGLAAGTAGVATLEGGLAGAPLADLVAGLEELTTGVAQLRSGVRDQLLPGAEELAAGLADGAADIEDSGLADLAGDPQEPFVLTAAMVHADPSLREELAFFVTEDTRRTRVFVGLDDAPFSSGALATVRVLRTVVERSLVASPLAEATTLLTGSAAFLEEVDRAAARDFPVLVVAVLGGVFLVLVVLLRSLVAPTYMIVSVLASYGAALGATAVVVQGLLGEPGLQWYIPPLLFVLLVALGVDYSIFLMGRVREEARTRTTVAAVGEGVRRTGRIITSAGVILAGTFAVLLFAPLRSLAHMGLAAAIGILLDTFVVRALLVPALAVLLGRWNWWPSRAAGD